MKVFGLKRGGDPLLSRLVRGAVNRPSLERRVGLMAQDFFQTFAGENLFLTRHCLHASCYDLKQLLRPLVKRNVNPSIGVSGLIKWKSLIFLSPESPLAPSPHLDARKESWSARTVTFGSVSVRHTSGIFAP
jgi:hypothetical protein